MTHSILLDARVAIVTGGARGLGRTMADALVRAGCTVIYADADGDVAQQAVRKINQETGSDRAVTIGCDVSRQDQCAHVIDEAKRRFGALHILVNNAARGAVQVEKAPGTRSIKFHETDPDAWADVIATNVTGCYFMARHAAPVMIAGGWGRIVNITTSLSTMQRVANSPYGVSKAAIEAETLIWAQDLLGTGVTVNSLIPGGAADTDFVSAKQRAAAAATGRKLLDPQVMVDPLLWLVSTQSDDITGGRFVGKLWDASLPAAAAAQKAREAPVLRPASQAS